MAQPSVSSLISYVFARQIDDTVDHCKRLVNARFETSENLYRKDLFSHYGCVNAIEFSNEGDLLVSGGDDKRVLLWFVEEAIEGVRKPAVMNAQHESNIFCVGCDSSKTKIFSAGSDDQIIVHDLRTCDTLEFFSHEKSVYGLSIHPYNDNVFASAGDNGKVLIYDIRSGSATETFCLAQYESAFQSVMFNPVEPRLLATTNAKEGISMWDVRKPLEPVLRYGSESPAQNCINVRFNARGNTLLVLRKRLPPVLYAVDSPVHLCEFDHPGYYNGCTMKSCCFAGDNDEYVLSGSDDFNLYMWKIPPEGVKWVDTAHMALRGHRSIVNQVRYNQASCIFASSGVEKIIKIWSPFSLGDDCLGGLKKDSGKQEPQRRVYTRSEYLRLVMRSGHITHDYSHQSTKEDPLTMAFFDNFLQHKIEESSSEDTLTTSQPFSDSAIRIYNAIASDDFTELIGMLATAVSSRRSSGVGVTPENQLGARDQIRPGTMYCSTSVNNPNAASDLTASGSASDGHNVQVKCRSKSKLKPKKNMKKYGKISRRRSKTRRKCITLKINDSDSDEQPVDATQPSTSSGVISRRSRYTVNTIESYVKHSNYTSSSSEENDSSVKRKYSKTDSDNGTNVHRRKHRKCKYSSKRDCSKSKCKRQKVDIDTQDNGATWNMCRNNIINQRLQTDESSTSFKKLCTIPLTPDSGIISGVSTVEKNDEQARKERNGAESSDYEPKVKNMDHFKKKLDVARRGYRNRSTFWQTISTTTDSSD